MNDVAAMDAPRRTTRSHKCRTAEKELLEDLRLYLAANAKSRARTRCARRARASKVRRLIDDYYHKNLANDDIRAHHRRGCRAVSFWGIGVH